jgi:carbon monoxide dehydrogenase subunit G
VTRVAADVERSAEVGAAPEDVWAVVSDVERLGELMPEVETYEPVERGWRWVMAPQQRLGQTFQPHFTVRYTLEEPEEVRFERVTTAGETSEAEGHIRVSADGADGARVDFRLELTVDVPVPRLLVGSVRAMLTDEIRRLADGFLANVRAAAE